jgi:hypothetical protein
MLLVKQQEKLMVVSSETCMIKRQYKFPMEFVSPNFYVSSGNCLFNRRVPLKLQFT